ncbi:hypothetical protein ACWGJP_03550 [Microbacterium sp. NPDC055903]
MRIRLPAALAACALITGSLTGCGVMSDSCIDWVYFETPADAAEDADAVVLGTIVQQTGTTTYLGMTATTWMIQVDEWVDGNGDEEIVVTSLPRRCGDRGDTMADRQGEEGMILFLRDDDETSTWQAITPWQGVVPAGPGGSIPESWPDDIYD